MRSNSQCIFTVVHHREIPDGLKAGTIDVGIAWATEFKNALKEGVPIQAVSLPAKDSMIDDVSYAIGILDSSKHKQAAKEYMSFLQSKDGQNSYEKFGFIQAAKADLKIRKIPD